MRIPKIEPIQIRAPFRRMDSGAWIAQTTNVLTSVHNIAPDTWKQVPMALFGAVILRYALNHAKDLEDMRSMVSDAMERTSPGGLVVAVARACDNGQELAERMVQSGIDPEQLGVANLSNGEIARLQPNAAVILTSSSVFKLTDSTFGTEEELAEKRRIESARFLEWAGRVRQAPTAPELRFHPERLATRITDVGLVWRKH